jgi:type II secretory pathway pseudopilin PulG
MQHGLKLRNRMMIKRPKGQRGYMLITLVFALALISIALLAVLPDITQQIKRDREDEMRHRGMSYMRAIQHFYKKFGRYPSRIEELENTNNTRFLRKRYTDPMSIDRATGKEKDFKILHQTDITLNSGPILGQTPGQGLLPGQNGQAGQSAFGAAAGGLGAVQSALGGLGAQTGPIQQNAGLNAPASGDSSGSTNATGDANSTGSSGSSPSNSISASGSGLNGQTFGGGPILGVASTSKAKSIRVFYQKNHYNDWLFVYVPQADRGGLLMGPINPGAPATVPGGLTGMAPGMQVSGAPAQGGFGQSGFGQGLGTAPNNNQTQTPPAQTQPN